MSPYKSISLMLLLWLCLLQPTMGFGGEPLLAAPHRSKQSDATPIGVKECAACHSAPSPIYQFRGVTRFVRLVESKEWLERDKHAYAYQLVRRDKPKQKSNKLSDEITTKLKYKEGDFERNCLTCHAGLNANEDYSSREVKLDLEFGVRCESCHGPGSEYTKREHHQQVSWRGLKPEEKSEHGMWDLTSPSTAAAVCLSCHLGNIAENRFVTHDMYAAGHPVLPPFDLQVFLNAMPPHWQTIQKKSGFGNTLDPNDPHLEAKYISAHYDLSGTAEEIRTAIEGSYDKTRRSMIGGLVANDVGLELIHQGAAKTDSWGDYSNYNCMGCHQELKKNSTTIRQESRIPGRPFPANWLTLDYPKIHASGQETREFLTRELFASFNSVPFGDAQRINQLRDRQMKSFEERFLDRRKMERQVMSKEDVLQWLLFLTQSRQDSMSDFWVARQTAWMVCVAIDELVEHGAIAPDAVETAKKELQKLLRLELQIEQTASVLDSQSDILETAKRFDSVRCVALVKALVETAIEAR